MNKFLGAIVVPALVLFARAGAGEEQQIKFSGWGWMTAGQVGSSISEKTQYDLKFDKQWLVNYETGLKAVVQRGDRVKARLHLMTSLYYPVIRNLAGLSTAEPLKRSFFVTLLDAAIQSTWGIMNDRDTLFAEFGYLPVKYNPQAMNLGEYLFRSGTYPGYLVSGFELADKVKVTGLHLSYKMNNVLEGSLKQDLYFTNDMDVFPVNDFSLAYLVDYASIGKFLNFGAGVQFAHLIVVDPMKTDPYKNTEKWRRYEPQVSTVDTAPPYDTTFYTFRGTKIMARLMLNPRVFIPEEVTFLGKEDLKVYGEAAILGVKDYKGWYHHFKERIPVMFGMNWPTSPLLSYAPIPGLFRYLAEQKWHKYVWQVGGLGVFAGVGVWLLEKYTGMNLHPDITAVEGEWYGFKYWNTPEFIWKELTTRPYTGLTRVTGYYEPNSWTAKHDDDWRWSMYMSKKIGKSFRVAFQVASDHYNRSLWAPSTMPKYTEICGRTIDWYWMSRVMYYF